MMLTIYIDFKSPASYLAFEPTLLLAEKTGAPLHWRPFSSRPFFVPELQSDETVGERHRRVRAIAQRNMHLHYANVQGQQMTFADQPAESELALAALATMDGDPVPYMRTAFAAYWHDQANLNDENCVADMLRANGKDVPDFDTACDRLAAIRMEAQESGIFEAPAYHIADQLFLGREHLPWITAMITTEQSA